MLSRCGRFVAVIVCLLLGTLSGLLAAEAPPAPDNGGPVPTRNSIRVRERSHKVVGKWSW